MCLVGAARTLSTDEIAGIHYRGGQLSCGNSVRIELRHLDYACVVHRPHPVSSLTNRLTLMTRKRFKDLERKEYPAWPIKRAR